ncbi:Small conductance calcium-activated potassium channel protein [Eumeta japonica]|uniref:Small conductance calcium-activated potassium channel protein n=1 Tax=Eumeta variegata TaxID=151549 RepID=A0A4C1TCR9_EUMVA|nr:Small conductance calcium-activated potassium channel protein [Eumeta japonica]
MHSHSPRSRRCVAGLLVRISDEGDRTDREDRTNGDANGLRWGGAMEGVGVSGCFVNDPVCALQLRKPVSTLSIPGAMKAYSGARDAGEEADVALVGVHSEYPRYGEERALGGGTYKGGGTAKHKPNIGYSVATGGPSNGGDAVGRKDAPYLTASWQGRVVSVVFSRASSCYRQRIYFEEDEWVTQIRQRQSREALASKWDSVYSEHSNTKGIANNKKNLGQLRRWDRTEIINNRDRRSVGARGGQYPRSLKGHHALDNSGMTCITKAEGLKAIEATDGFAAAENKQTAPSR